MAMIAENNKIGLPQEIHGPMQICFYNRVQEEVSILRLQPNKPVCTRPKRKLPTGSLLMEVERTDFDNPESFKDFVSAYGIGGFIGYSDTAKGLRWTQEIFDGQQYLKILEQIRIDAAPAMKSHQEDLRKLIYYCLDLNGPEWAKKLNTKQRYHIASSKRLISETHKTVENITTSSTLEPINGDLSLREKAVYKVEELADIIKEYEFDEKYCFSSEDIASISYLSFKEMVINNITVRRCLNCDSYFASRPLEKYCDRVIDFYPDGTPKTCKMVGPKKSYLNNPLKKEYETACRTMRARKKRGGIYRVKEDEYPIWQEQANQMLEKALNKEITEEQFRAWLRYTKDNFREWIKNFKEGI